MYASPGLWEAPKAAVLPMRHNQAQFDYDIFNKSLEMTCAIFLDDLVFAIS